MATLTIRRLDDGIYDRLKARAAANQRSLEAEARDILDMQTRDRTAAVAGILAFAEKMRAKYGLLPDSLPFIRADRDGE